MIRRGEGLENISRLENIFEKKDGQRVGAPTHAALTALAQVVQFAEGQTRFFSSTGVIRINL